ncbi:Cyclin domain protein [Pleurostoma richardsiae]|uniref:Cyclin domain protein n=1 Tax=Pleurostoma richardsiae TaxID=41990 RepID=A0AA38R6M5_9PEZI|nr:Cyclin domain protein [Pleurostoma richardsiae]
MAPPYKGADMSEDDDFDFDAYFSSTYRPLSNLPTPPPSSRDDSSFIESPASCLEDGECLESDLLGPAIHLVNLLPPAASLATPSVPLVQAILSRARLPLDIVALAVCILDSLGSKFSLSWRLTCPLRRDPFLASPNKRHTLPAGPPTPEQQNRCLQGPQLHIDSVHPEVIILAALVIASKFLEDFHEPTRYYASDWGRDLWTCEQINATEVCIMESLDWRILPLWDRELIDDALSDMRKAGRQAQQQASGGSKTVMGSRAGCVNAPAATLMSSGKGVIGLGLQLTPLDTPTEDGCSSSLAAMIRGKENLGPASLFRGPPTPAVTQESLRLPRADHRRNKTFSRLEGLIDGMTHP